MAYSFVPYSSKNIANAFFERAQRDGKILTNMQLQKLVYFANGWSLALWKEPLIKEQIKAWTFGPVIPPLYNELKNYGNGQVTSKIDVPDVEFDSKTNDLLDRIWASYGHLSGSQMSALTHQKGSAWRIAYEKAKFSDIDDCLITEEFSKQMVAS